MFEVNAKIVAKCKFCGDEIYEITNAENKKDFNGLCEDCNEKKEVKTLYEQICSSVDYFIYRFHNDEQKREKYGIPKRYMKSSLENFIGDVNTPVSKWLKNGESNMLIQSPKAGNGKTHLSIALLGAWVQSKRDYMVRATVIKKKSAFGLSVVVPTCRYTNFASLVLELKGSFEGVGVSEQKIINEYSMYDILVLDDLGSEKYSEYVQGVIYTILNNRYDSMKPTIVTTNLSSKDITKTYGSRILSRLLSGEMITLNGEDLRIKNR